MVAATQIAKPFAETLRMICATIRHLTFAATRGEPAPYWTDYLRNTRN
jgi:hypothetical protein